MGAMARFEQFGIATQAVNGGDVLLRCTIAFTNERLTPKPILTVSALSGTPIREVTRINPAQVERELITLSIGLRDYQVRTLASSVDIPEEHWDSFIELAHKLYQCHLASDALHSELNPLVLYQNGTWIAQGGSIEIDPNAAFRQSEPLFDPPVLTGMCYIPLSGNVSCVANGAGLTMHTLDMIVRAGGTPANFLDLGGGSLIEKISRAYEFINAQNNIPVVFVNLFCGVTWCVDIVRELIPLMRANPLRSVMVLRLAGFDAEEANEMLKQANIPNLHITDEHIAEAAAQAVTLAQPESERL